MKRGSRQSRYVPVCNTSPFVTQNLVRGAFEVGPPKKRNDSWSLFCASAAAAYARGGEGQERGDAGGGLGGGLRWRR